MAAVAFAERNDAGAKVTIACKLPAGVVLRGQKKQTEREAVLGGGVREYEAWRPTGEQVEIFGTAVEFGKAPKTQIVFGYALTHNVSKDLWDNWFEGNKDSPLVKNKLIFAYEKAHDAQDAAKDHESTVSGFEPVDPENPGKKVRGIEKATVKK